MINVTAVNGKTVYGIMDFTLDHETDVQNLPTDCAVGSSAFVIDTTTSYILNSEKKWIPI